MKNILLFASFCVFAISSSFAQYENVDFEAGGQGASWAWTMDSNGDNPPLEFIANPVSGGSNTTATVAKFTARVGGNPWALTYTDDIDEFEFDATNVTVKIMVYKPEISNVGMKFEGPGGAPIEILIPNTVVNQWEEITFDFTSAIGNTYNRMVIIPDFQTRAQDNILYFDNIQVPTGNVVPAPEPTVGAPVPTHNEVTDNVLSIYSDAYTDITGTDFNPNWGQSTAQSFVMVDGNPTNKYANLTYQGTQFAAAQDVSANGYIHVDFWTPNAASIQFFLISATTGEKFVELPITAEQWVSVDIPLHEFVSQGLGITDIHQFKIVGNGNVWFDNWYFHSDYFSPPQPMPLTAAPTPTHNEVTDNVLSIYSGAYTDVAGTDFNPNWGQTTAQSFETIAGDPTNKYAGLNYQGTQIAAAQDVSANGFIHIDFWTNNSTFLEFFLISLTTGERKFDLPIVADQWVSVDIPVNHFVDLGLAMTDIHQFKVVGDGNVWFDNWYFHSDYVPTVAPMPSGPAAVPTHDQTNNSVISVFTDVYTNIPGTNYNPNWGQSTAVTFEDFSGNFLMKYAGLNYQGTDFSATPQDVSNLEFLHVDFWTNNSTDLGIYLISTDGAEHEYVFTITPDSWNSIDIPLAHFANGDAVAGSAAVPVDLTEIMQLKVEGNGTIWWDNIYFWASAQLPAELIAFDANAKGNQIELNWETASEENTDYFEIQRSADGRSFETIGRVEAAGNSIDNQYYNLMDRAPLSGINYYRLKQVDINRTETNSEIVSAKYQLSNEIELVKNIVNGNEILLDYNVVDSGNYNLSVFDISGRMLFDQDVLLSDGINQLNINTAATGVLILRLSNAHGQVIDKIFK